MIVWDVMHSIIFFIFIFIFLNSLWWWKELQHNKQYAEYFRGQVNVTLYFAMHENSRLPF